MQPPVAPTDTRGHLTALVLLTDSPPASCRFLVRLVCPLLVPHSETSSLTPEQPAANTHCNMTARKRNKSQLSRCFLRELLKHTAATTSNTATTAITTNTFPFIVEATLKHPFQPSCRHVFTSSSLSVASCTCFIFTSYNLTDILSKSKFQFSRMYCFPSEKGPFGNIRSLAVGS